MRHVVVDARVAGLERVRRRRAKRAQMNVAFFKEKWPRGNFGLYQRFLGAEIKDPRPRAFVGLSDGERLAVKNFGKLARRIFDVAENTAFRWTDADTRGLEPVLDAIRTEVAFFRRARVRIDEQLIVGTRDHARAASDARVAVQIDDAVVASKERVRRTD